LLVPLGVLIESALNHLFAHSDRPPTCRETRDRRDTRHRPGALQVRGLIASIVALQEVLELMTWH
ncbi:hypothetical protein ACC677_38000, partial [Rhizobium ruizarguesonis]